MTTETRLIYIENDSVAILTPAKGVATESLVKLVPTGCEYKIVPQADIPTRRTYRDAWKDLDLAADLEKVKKIHRKNIIDVSKGRVPTNEYGEKDLTQLKADMAEVDVRLAAATTVDEVYNTWATSTNIRSEYRTYNQGKGK